MNLRFDAIASQFDDQRGLPSEALQAWLSLIDELAAGRQLCIVEPGIGTGRVALPLALAGHHITGADISWPMLALCAASAARLGVASRITLIHADATDLPLPDAASDAGIIAQVLYLVPDWPAVLDELARLVRPGGYVIHLSEPTTESEALHRWSSTWRRMIEDTGHTHAALTPTEADVHAEFMRRWCDVQVKVLASWSFGQSVAQAIEGYADRLRPLYESVPEGDWRAATAHFLTWARTAFPNGSERLDGTVTLTATIAAV